jgi:hypothetical protein
MKLYVSFPNFEGRFDTSHKYDCVDAIIDKNGIAHFYYNDAPYEATPNEYWKNQEDAIADANAYFNNAISMTEKRLERIKSEFEQAIKNLERE